ncbi:hypothetical protein CORC01_08933 [Colletotrichum orchidophilum]|uniref:Hyphal anastamosis-8 protein n=1 Tax=Colletotrichum orchidophilum TaxID=1209926 RepID=A0A1G4B3C9_9PEZI|nr:uncharacterized protein CORC01_08933 [Colletotrichum orchidophilum]OHE95792.1 hypothetical protein CORC01_08933 [Colletotrichum orchidophilum]
MAFQEDRRRPAALNLAPARSASTDSSSSDSSLKPPRTPRFAEATSVHSPVDGVRSPFADPVRSEVPQSQPGDIGFGYINNSGGNRESVAVPMTPRSPLKSAMRVPGTPARKIVENPLSPTFREEDILEKREAATDKEQARDLKIKTRVRMAKFALRGVSFSCSLIIISMIAASFQIFNATKRLPAQSGLPSWAEGTAVWPQVLVITMSSISLAVCIGVLLAYCRGGHQRAEKVSTYYTLFAIGWFIISMVMWAIAAGIFQTSRNNGGGKDMWGWSCKENKRAEVFSDKVDYALICRLQNWALICMVIEIVIDVICVLLYSIIFYRYYTKRRLHKSMDMRDRARSDLYLAQLRTQSAPNTPGLKSPGLKSPGLYSQYALSPRHPDKTFESLSRIEEAGASPFTPGTRFVEPESSFNKPKPTFQLQAPPTKARAATKPGQEAYTPTSPEGPGPAFPFQQQQQQQQPSQGQPQQHAPMAADEPVYDAVPIPGAYADAPVKSPPPHQFSFGQAR